MPSEPQPSESHEALSRAERELEELVFECLERVEREGPAALSAICHEHAQRAPALLERVRALLESGLFDVGSPAEVEIRVGSPAESALQAREPAATALPPASVVSEREQDVERL